MKELTTKKLPRGMFLGLILPLGLIDAANYDALIIDWPKFLAGLPPELATKPVPPLSTPLYAALGALQEEIIEFLVEVGLDGIILRLDQAAVSKAGYFFWRHYYGYCQNFSEVEEAIQSLIEKASQEDAA